MPPSALTTRAVVLRRTPSSVPRAGDFEVAQVELPPRGIDQVRIRVDDLSLDPYLRSLIGPGHLGDGPIVPGQVMPGRSVGTVLEPGDGLPPGTRVLAETGWRAEAVLDAAAVDPVRVPDGVPVSTALGALGMPGLTAYAAHRRHLRPRPGETVVISSATGGVGAVAGQLARLAGARTVAIVGNEAKAAIATEQLGYDLAVVRGRPGWVDALHDASPERIDCYLHMGDQATLDGVVEHLALGARVCLVGLMDQTNGAAATRVRAGALMAARATTYGMVVHDHADLAAEHVERVGGLLASGRIVAPEDRYLGLERAGEAFATLLSGRNRGKVVVQVSPIDREDPS